MKLLFGLLILLTLSGCTTTRATREGEEKDFKQVYGETYDKGIQHPTWQEKVFAYLGIK